MTKRRGDTTPEPPGGRAAERLKMFESARAPTPELPPGVPPVKKARAVRKSTTRRRKA
jgi:hypothetical protein